MNTKHIPPFPFPKSAYTVFVMTICEEISGISAIPTIVDCRIIHYRLSLPWALWDPQRGAAGLPSAAGTAQSLLLLHFLQKNIQSYQNTGTLHIQALVLGFRGKKNVNFQIEFHLAHQPDCPAVLHCHVQSAAGFLLENKLHWIRTMPEALLGRDIAALFAFFFLIFLGFLVTTLGLYKTYWSALSILMVMTKTSSVTWDSLKKHYKSEGFFSFNRLFHVRWIFI